MPFELLINFLAIFGFDNFVKLKERINLSQSYHFKEFEKSDNFNTPNKLSVQEHILQKQVEGECGEEVEREPRVELVLEHPLLAEHQFAILVFLGHEEVQHYVECEHGRDHPVQVHALTASSFVERHVIRCVH